MVERERLERRGAELRLGALHVADAEAGRGDLRGGEGLEPHRLGQPSILRIHRRPRRLFRSRRRFDLRAAITQRLDERRGEQVGGALELRGQEHRDAGRGCHVVEELEVDPDQLVGPVVDGQADALRLQEPCDKRERLPDETGAVGPAVLGQSLEGGLVAIVEGGEEGVGLVLASERLRRAAGVMPASLSSENVLLRASRAPACDARYSPRAPGSSLTSFSTRAERAAGPRMRGSGSSARRSALFASAVCVRQWNPMTAGALARSRRLRCARSSGRGDDREDGIRGARPGAREDALERISSSARHIRWRR